MTDKNDDVANERDAAKDFFGNVRRGAKGPRKPVDPALARQNAQAASGVAKELLAQHLPEPLPEVDVAPAQAGSVSVGVKTVACGCGQELGHVVRGVFTDGVWHCPKCFMANARSLQHHPVARAVDCPTCHRQTVDFTGRNVCSVCRSRGARPIKVA